MSSVLVLSFSAAFPLFSASQPASDPLCGAVVVEDLVLDRDIICYNSNGLTVGREGLTIDLNGKSIQCHNGTTIGCPGSRSIGIDASRVQLVAIKGPGAVQGFGVQFIAATQIKAVAQPAGTRSRAGRSAVTARVSAKRTAGAKAARN